MNPILGSIGETSFIPSRTSAARSHSAPEDAQLFPQDTLDLSPLAADAVRHDRESPSTPGGTPNATIAATMGFKGVAAEADMATRIPTDKEVEKLKGSGKKTGASAIQQATKGGASIHDLLKLVPKDAETRRFESRPNSTIKDGVSFKWKEMVDGKMKTFMFEVHGPDTGPHAGPNSQSGNIARLRESGNFYFDHTTRERTRIGKNTPESVANNTHVPLRGNLQTTYGALTQNLLKTERVLGRAMLPAEVGMGAYHLYNTSPEQRPREAAGLVGALGGAAALAKPCAIGGAAIAGPPGAIVGGLACGAIGAFAGEELGRSLYDTVR